MGCRYSWFYAASGGKRQVDCWGRAISMTEIEKEHRTMQRSKSRPIHVLYAQASVVKRRMSNVERRM